MKKFILICAFLLCCSGVVLASEVTLGWSPNTESDLKGYQLHYGTETQSPIIYIDMPKTLTRYTVGGLVQGHEYFFSLKAYDESLNKSGFSGEVSYLVPIADADSPIAPTIINIPDDSPVEININP